VVSWAGLLGAERKSSSAQEHKSARAAEHKSATFPSVSAVRFGLEFGHRSPGGCSCSVFMICGGVWGIYGLR
jgi:hypothetical protein